MSGWPLPSNPFPDDVVCIQVKVPNDPAYLEAFFGQMLDLATAFNWANDEAHTALLARNRMRQMYSELSENNCPVIPSIPGGCGGCDMCNQLRFNDCVLEQFDCFTQEWIPVPTVGVCVSNPAPGGGTTPPIGGACENYTLSADSRTLTPLPFLVNPGDTIQFTAIMGAATDGSGHWYCPDGSIFIAGACAGGGSPLAGDPLPTASHMAMLMKLGASYFPLNTSLFTVPSGPPNQQIYIQTNDPSLTFNSGTFNLALTYCNHAAPPVVAWCQTLNLLSTPGGIMSFTTNDGCGDPINNAFWSSGDGWETPAYNPSCIVGHSQTHSTIALDLGVSTTITSVELKGHYFGSGAHGRNILVLLSTLPPWDGAGTVIMNENTYPTGDFDFNSGSISMAARSVEIFCGDVEPDLSAGAEAYVYTELVLHGTGANPFAMSNCT